jgi:hypothetical protein
MTVPSLQRVKDLTIGILVGLAVMWLAMPFGNIYLQEGSGRKITPPGAGCGSQTVYNGWVGARPVTIYSMFSTVASCHP